ncbi:hypothetical protein FA95DRAFT_584719 [Auriscalpium vulgare]|uniref:Uncharacterized protein n=1 Tax=Auriscalpium vulgare TaxID=40419 RepID=A0ACB8REA9_9AGAM|nr:hypothetical protein FA95DRAFT_584719 [Auriscalpium vulgare]
MNAESDHHVHTALLPIARIPPDTLMTIFSPLAADVKNFFLRSDVSSSYPLKDLSWVTVTHVRSPSKTPGSGLTTSSSPSSLASAEFPPFFHAQSKHLSQSTN